MVEQGETWEYGSSWDEYRGLVWDVWERGDSDREIARVYTEVDAIAICANHDGMGALREALDVATELVKRTFHYMGENFIEDVHPLAIVKLVADCDTFLTRPDIEARLAALTQHPHNAQGGE